MILTRMRAGLTAVLLFGAPASVCAQPSDTLVVTGGSDGLRLRGRGFDVRLGAVVQGDARFFASEGDVGNDQFLLRRARILMQGDVGGVGFRVVPDFGQGRMEIEEAWAEAPLLPAVGVRAGVQKVPVGMEWLRSSSDGAFVERALPTALVARSEPGVSVRGEPADGFEYALGVFNGAPDGQGSIGDAGDGKDVAARVFAEPFSGALAGLGIGLGASYGIERGSTGAPALSSYRTATGRTIAAWLSGDTTTVAEGTRTRLAPQASFTRGPFSAYGEWTRSSHEVTAGDETDRIAATAWQVAGTVVLTGENATLGRLRPARPIGDGGLGAFELAARYHALSLDDDAFPLFMDPATNARAARSVTLGLNWFLTPHARATVNAERTSFSAPAGFEDPPAEVVFLGRMQVSI